MGQGAPREAQCLEQGVPGVGQGQAPEVEVDHQLVKGQEVGHHRVPLGPLTVVQRLENNQKPLIVAVVCVSINHKNICTGFIQ